MFRGHTDDVSRFVVGQGMLVSGGRDRSICAWNSATGDFMFARWTKRSRFLHLYLKYLNRKCVVSRELLEKNCHANNTDHANLYFFISVFSKSQFFRIANFSLLWLLFHQKLYLFPLKIINFTLFSELNPEKPKLLEREKCVFKCKRGGD